MFFKKEDRVHRTMRLVADRLDAAGIPYAIVGGMAVNAHRHERTTGDVDFLITAEGFFSFQRRYVEKEFQRVPGRPRRFLDTQTGVSFDLLITGMFPGSGNPGPVSFPDPAEVSETIDGLQIVNLIGLVQLKLAARRFQDFADVLNLIRSNDLDESFQSNLHPSLHSDYIECLEEKRREDEYEARQDRAFEERTRDSGQ